jgi:chromosome segregation ATPase
VPTPSASSLPGVGRVVSRVDAAIRWRADEQVAAQLSHLNARLDEITRRLDQIGHENFWTAEEMRRVAPQVSALEVRMEDMRVAIQTPSGSTEELAEARSIVDDVRREHDRAKARLDSASWYEDRIRQLEDRVQRLTERVDQGPSAD